MKPQKTKLRLILEPEAISNCKKRVLLFTRRNQNKKLTVSWLVRENGHGRNGKGRKFHLHRLELVCSRKPSWGLQNPFARSSLRVKNEGRMFLILGLRPHSRRLGDQLQLLLPLHPSTIFYSFRRHFDLYFANWFFFWDKNHIFKILNYLTFQFLKIRTLMSRASSILENLMLRLQVFKKSTRCNMLLFY